MQSLTARLLRSPLQLTAVKHYYYYNVATAQSIQVLKGEDIAMANLIESKSSQLKRTVSRRVSDDSRERGEERYGNWASNNYRWDESDYNHRGFRAVYFDKLFETRAELVHEALDYCDSDLPNFLEEDNLKVVSFGCGPGCDLLGFQQYYQQKKKKRIDELKKRLKRRQAQAQGNSSRQRSTVDDIRTKIREIQSARVSYTRYDSSSGWREYFGSLGPGYNFSKQHINKRFVDGMQPVDVAILCYFSHSANFHQPSKSAFWESLKRKCKVILVLDTTYNKQEFDDMLSSIGFRELDIDLKDDGDREVYTTLWTHQ